MLQTLFASVSIALAVGLLGAAPASAQPKPRIERAAVVLPNLLAVGAVDHAGNEASFTRYGPTVRALAAVQAGQP